MFKPEKEYVRKLIEENMRVDERKFDEFRNIEIETGIFPKAEGSARVKLGDTEVVAGVKLNVDEPFPDTPNEGIMIVNAEFPPIASPDFEPGPPGEDAIELARIVDRGIRESGAIDMEKLCIKEGEKVWSVFIDIHVINDDGNLIDASGIAAIAALLDTKIPKYDEEKDEIKRGEYVDKLPVVKIPIPVTSYKINGKLVLDATREEEESIDARITITTTGEHICSIQKGHGGYLTEEELFKAIEYSFKKGEEIRNLIKEKLNL